MHRATFRIAGEGGPAAATEGTDLRAELWCNDHCDLIHARGPDPEPFLDRVRAVCGIRDALFGPGEVVAITGDCLTDHEPTVDPFLADHGCLLVPPIVYADGGKRIRVLALSPAALSGAYADLRERFSVTVEETREIDAVGDPPGIGGGPDLSPRQRQVLRIAHRDGYFAIPRGTSTEAIAEEVGIDRRTAEEHLRKAERRVIDAFADRRFP